MRLDLALAWVGGTAAAGRGAFRGAHAKGQGHGYMENVAIVGAGAAGASAAYHLRKYADQQGLGINVTIFEKTDRVGGRSLTINAFDNRSEPVELGASIFVSINHILYNATKTLNLSLTEMSIPEIGDVSLIWDGQQVVFETVEGTPWWREAGRLFLRYGLAPLKAVKLVKSTVGIFLRLYDAPYFPFRSLNQRVHELGLGKVTAVTGEQFLAEKKINADFVRHIMQPATRVNYASNLAYIHGLEAMVSFATEGAMAVSGGNWQIFDNMVRSSGATLHRNTSVTAISLRRAGLTPGTPRKYMLSTKHSGATSAKAETNPVAFDKIIVASPWQFSGIQVDRGLLGHPIDSIPYMKLHVTLFASSLSLRPEYFNLEAGRRPPSNVYTTLGKDEEPKQGPEGVGRTGFYSISTLRRVINPKTQQREYLYKIFSASPITSKFLSDILGADVPPSFVTAAGRAGQAISWYHPHWFHSYPIELPRVTFQDPVVGRGLYYTSGIESFISTMETSALMGMNVARLVADSLAGLSRNGMSNVERGRVLSDFFDSVESEMGRNINAPGMDEL